MSLLKVNPDPPTTEVQPSAVRLAGRPFPIPILILATNVTITTTLDFIVVDLIIRIELAGHFHQRVEAERWWLDLTTLSGPPPYWVSAQTREKIRAIIIR